MDFSNLILYTKINFLKNLFLLFKLVYLFSNFSCYRSYFGQMKLLIFNR